MKKFKLVVVIIAIVVLTGVVGCEQKEVEKTVETVQEDKQTEDTDKGVSIGIEEKETTEGEIEFSEEDQEQETQDEEGIEEGKELETDTESATESETNTETEPATESETEPAGITISNFIGEYLNKETNIYLKIAEDLVILGYYESEGMFMENPTYTIENNIMKAEGELYDGFDDTRYDEVFKIELEKKDRVNVDTGYVTHELERIK